MSALVFVVNEDSINILTDTLAVNIDGSFNRYTAKTLTLSHISSTISGLGVAGLADQLFLYANSQPIHNIHDLTAFAESCLPAIFQEITEGFVIPNHITSTIYLFGIDPSTGKAHAFKHESTSNFKSIDIAPEHYSAGAKPTDGLTQDDLTISTTEEALLVLLKSKAAQDSLSAEERLYIGGQITLTEITPRAIVATNILDLDSDVALAFINKLGAS